MDLQPGQNFSISKHSLAPNSVEMTLHWEPTTTPLTLDSSAFALTTQGKVRGDDDFVFYNQPALPGVASSVREMLAPLQSLLQSYRLLSNAS